MNKYLVCVDSDGCAMDTMTIKHVKCFGPCLIDEWELHSWKEEILKRWNDINLYTKTRGINRFSGLAVILREIDQNYKRIEGLDTYSRWVESTDAYSEAALKKMIQENPGEEILKKALHWSQMVNIGIGQLRDDEKVEFAEARTAITSIGNRADLAIVSSANKEAMEEEWQRCGMLDYVEYSMAQDAGTKAECLRHLIEKGYDPERIIMVGDAVGDLKAATAAGVKYYPILVGHENESWEQFAKQILPSFLNGEYGDAAQASAVKKFYENFGSSV